MTGRRVAGLVVGLLFGAASAALVAGIGLLAFPRWRLWRRWGQLPNKP
jgi:hypothetical protein